MPRWMKFAALWVGSALAALALSWVAVSQVRDRVIQPVTVIPTTVAAVEAEVTEPTVVMVEPAPDSGSGDGVSSASPSTTAAVTASTTTRSPSGSPSTSTTTTPVSPATTAPPATTTVTAGLVSSSHTVSGGSVTIRSGPGEVVFVSAIPAPGFTTELRDQGPDRVRVRFVSASLVSEFEAEWDDGELDISSEDHSLDD